MWLGPEHKAAPTLVPLVATAQPLHPPVRTITVGGKVWASHGSSNCNFKSAGVYPLTDRSWRGSDAALGEVSAAVVWQRVVWMIGVAGKTLDQNALTEEHFARSNRQGRYSVTDSLAAEGYIRYASSDIGARVAEWRQPLFGDAAPILAGGYLDVFIGYQFWREE